MEDARVFHLYGTRIVLSTGKRFAFLEECPPNWICQKHGKVAIVAEPHEWTIKLHCLLCERGTARMVAEEKECGYCGSSSEHIAVTKGALRFFCGSCWILARL